MLHIAIESATVKKEESYILFRVGYRLFKLRDEEFQHSELVAIQGWRRDFVFVEEIGEQP